MMSSLGNWHCTEELTLHRCQLWGQVQLMKLFLELHSDYCPGPVEKQELQIIGADTSCLILLRAVTWRIKANNVIRSGFLTGPFWC